MYTAYILENTEGRFYIGYTSKKIKERLSEHNQGKCRWTNNKGPWSVCHIEQYKNREEAYRRERNIKSYKGGRALKELIN